MCKSLGSAWTLLLLMFLGAGCDSDRPIKYFVRTGPTYATTMPTVDEVGLLVDATVQYDRGYTNYLDLDDSRAAISNIVHETRKNLELKGYRIAFVESPFVGSFKSSSGNYLVADHRKGVPSWRSAPFEISTALDSDASYRDGLLKTARGLFTVVQNRGEIPTEMLREDDATRAALESIANKKNVRYLLVILGDGQVVSARKQASQEIDTAIFSTVVTLGTVTVVAHNASFLKSFVALVDLRNAEVVWCNWMPVSPLNPANADSYRFRWPRSVLHWLPARGKLEPIEEPYDRPTAQPTKGRQ